MLRPIALTTILMLAAIQALAQSSQRRPGQKRRPGQSRPSGRVDRFPDKLKVGDAAPDFTLKSPDGKTEVTLSEFQGKKPVALVFGSYT